MIILHKESLKQRESWSDPSFQTTSDPNCPAYPQNSEKEYFAIFKSVGFGSGLLYNKS